MEIRFLFSTNTKPMYRIIAIMFGLMVTVLQLFNLLMVLIRRNPACQKWSTWYYSLGNVKYEAQIKKAGMFKVDQMLVNALKLHSESLKIACSCDTTKSKRIRSQTLTNYGRGLFEYSKLDGVMTKIGGIIFTWRRICNGALFAEDGETLHKPVLHLTSTLTLFLFLVFKVYGYPTDWLLARYSRSAFAASLLS